MRQFLILFVIALSSSVFAADVLVIGDSLSCGPFGHHLVTTLSQNGDKVSLYCAVSSTPSHWIRGQNPKYSQCEVVDGQKKCESHINPCQTMTTSHPEPTLCEPDGKLPTLNKLLQSHPGARVIVGLGTNSLCAVPINKLETKCLPRDKQHLFAIADYKAMAAEIGKTSKCEWIGPPRLEPLKSKGFPRGHVQTEDNNVDAFYQDLQSNVASVCRVIDSRNATRSGTPGNDTVDGIHRSEAAGKIWVQLISPDLIEGARVPSDPNEPRSVQ